MSRIRREGKTRISGGSGETEFVNSDGRVYYLLTVRAYGKNAFQAVKAGQQIAKDLCSADEQTQRAHKARKQKALRR
jgi:hypothetical protein